jgi:dTDP-4-dehydrorhamnose 3,5-epimerase
MDENRMFQDGTVEGVVFRSIQRCDDSPGWRLELFRDDELPGEHRPMMSRLTMTLPGQTRGPHEHQQQSDLLIFVGSGDFKLYLWDSRRDSQSYKVRQVAVVGESNRQAVIVPPGVVHAYRNISNVPGLVFSAPNRLYAGWGRSEPVDEIPHDDPNDPHVMD